MRQSFLIKSCVLVSFVSVLTACEEPRYVDNNGVRYYDANDVATDTLPSGPYTKGGQYVVNPDEATNTRDNRGSRPTGYGHDVNDDYRQPAYYTAPGGYPVYPAGTVVYGDGTVVYPDGAVVYPAPVRRTTTVITPETTTTTVVKTYQ